MSHRETRPGRERIQNQDMRVFTRYLVREFLAKFLLCEVIFIFLYVFIDFTQTVDNFMEAGASKWDILVYYLYYTPFISVQMMPAAGLIGLLITLVLMKRNNEIIAMKSCGMNTFSISRPIMATCFVLVIFVFLVSEIIVPFTSSKSGEIWKTKAQQWNPKLLNRSFDIWYRSPNAIYKINVFDWQTKTMEQASFYFFDKHFHLIKRIDCRRGVWENGVWRLEDGIIQVLGKDGNYDIKRFHHFILHIPETPATFVKQEKDPDEMSYWQLKKYAKRIGLEGYDNTKYLVDLEVKTAFPWAIFVMAILGVPMALARFSDRVPLAFAAGVAICFVYMLLLGISRSLGLSGILPPLLSAWLANLVFFFVGLYWMIHAER